MTVEAVEVQAARSARNAGLVSAQLLTLSLLLGIALAVPLFFVQDLTRDIAPTLALISANVWAGSSLWVLAIRRSVGITEALGVGVASAFMVPSLLLLATPLGLPNLLNWLILPALAIAVVACCCIKSLHTPSINFAYPSWVGAGIAILAGIALNRYWLELYRTPNLPDPTRFHPDMFALEAIVQANPSQGLGQIGMMADWPMRYHWLSYGWAGSLSETTHATPFFTVAQVMPLLALFGTSLITAAIANRLTSRRWVPAVAALIAICGHQIGDSSGLAINWESPSQAVSTVSLLMSLLLLLHARREQSLLVLCLALSVVAFVTTGFKFSAGAVLLAGTIGYILVAVMQRRLSRAHLWVILAVVLGVGAFWVLFQSGQETGGLLIPRMIDGGSIFMPEKWLESASNLKTAAWRTIAVLPGWAGLIYLFVRYRVRMQPFVGAALFMAGAGLIPLWLFQEIAPTSTFFLASAVSGITAISVTGAGKTLEGGSRGLTRRLLLAGAALSLCSVTVWAIIAVRLSGSDFILPLIYPVVLGFLVGVFGLGLKFFSIENSLRLSVATLTIAATLSPLLVLIPERVFSTQLPMSAPRATQSVDSDPFAVAPPLLSDGKVFSALSGTGLTNRIVAFADDSLMPTILTEQIRPYVSWPSWVTLNGPVGTTTEYERRLTLTKDAIIGDTGARRQLCSEGVFALASKDAGSSGFKVASLAQDCETQ